jgi:hypothetical protein
MIWGSLLLFIFAAIALYLQFSANNKRKNQLVELRENWGKPKESAQFNFNQIGKYFRHQTEDSSAYFQVIPDSVFTDLNLEAVFEFIDRTISRIGQQYLYYKLRTVEKNAAKLRQFDDLAETFAGNEALRLNTQQVLLPLNQHNSYYFEVLIYGGEIKPPKWLPLVYLLTAGMVLLAIFAFWFPGLVLLMLPVFIFNLVIHYWNKGNINASNIALNEYLKTYHTGLLLSKVPELKNRFSDVSFLQELAPINRQMKLISLNNLLENDSTNLIYGIMEIVKIFLNAETLAFYGIIQKVKVRKNALNQLFCFIGETDAAISVASLRSGLPAFCKPDFSGAKQFQIQQLRHPLIPDCVPNDLVLNQKSLLLIGSNMSGKTTFIRTLALNLLLGQTLYTCVASHFQAPFSRLYSSVKIADDLLNATSYYLEEVNVIKEFMLQAASPEPALFILDEIFKGTNTVERIAAGKAILSYLAQGNHSVLVSTHDVELTQLLETKYDLYHFSETINQTDLVFDHKLKAGPLTTRNAIKILKINNFPTSVISDATATAGLFKSQIFIPN